VSECFAEWLAYRRAVSEVFHALSQPITALQCSLELTLRRARSAEELQSGLREGLENSQRLIRVLGWLRKFAEASEPKECTAVDLKKVLKNWEAEILPIAESLGKRIEIECLGANEVVANEDVVYEICMMIGDFVTASASKTIKALVAGESVSFLISANGVTIESASDMSTLLSQAPELAVACRLIQSMNGIFSVKKVKDRVVIKFALPKSDDPTETLAD
jgi:hypothetical protein